MRHDLYTASMIILPLFVGSGATFETIRFFSGNNINISLILTVLLAIIGMATGIVNVWKLIRKARWSRQQHSLNADVEEIRLSVLFCYESYSLFPHLAYIISNWVKSIIFIHFHLFQILKKWKLLLIMRYELDGHIGSTSYTAEHQNSDHNIPLKTASDTDAKAAGTMKSTQAFIFHTFILRKPKKCMKNQRITCWTHLVD